MFPQSKITTVISVQYKILRTAIPLSMAVPSRLLLCCMSHPASRRSAVGGRRGDRLPRLDSNSWLMPRRYGGAILLPSMGDLHPLALLCWCAHSPSSLSLFFGVHTVMIYVSNFSRITIVLSLAHMPYTDLRHQYMRERQQPTAKTAANMEHILQISYLFC